MWTQKRKKQHSKDDTGHRHARTQTPEVLALQTSARQGRKQRQLQERDVLCSGGSSVPPASESSFSAILTLGFRGKSLASHQMGGSSQPSLKISQLCPSMCLQSFMSGQLIIRWMEGSWPGGQEDWGSLGTCKHTPPEFLRCETKDVGSQKNRRLQRESGAHTSQAR